MPRSLILSAAISASSFLSAFAFSPALAQETDTLTPQELQALLPPSPDWNGASTGFVLPPEHEWATTSEKSGFSQTATYREVTIYSKRLSEASRHVDLQSIGQLPNGEHIWMLVVSTATDKTPAGLKESGKPTLFIEAGIHPGESMGVNGGLMLVRDLAVTGSLASLLEGANLLFVPVLNVNGYLRQSENGRINQYGPDTSGRRANGAWRNLNRDFGKLDTLEIRSIVGVMNRWDPDFFIDAHSTDGQNYQYDVTWCDNGASGLSPNQYTWMRAEMQDQIHKRLAALGHIPGPCIDANDPMKPESGFYPYYSDGPAYSSNYADHRHLPAYLLELHSLKPYRQRVLGAYSFFLAVMEVMAEKSGGLKAVIAQDREGRIDPVPVAWDYDDPAPQFDFASFEYEIVENKTVGTKQMVWTDKPVTRTVEMSVRSTPLNPVARAKAYYVPAVWTDVIDRLKLHGIEFEKLTNEARISVERYKVEDFKIDNPNREGRATAAGTYVPFRGDVTYRPGDIRISTDQPLGTLATALLEPAGESSFFYWGFFNSQMHSHEFGENYITIPMAERMLQDDPDLAKAWDAAKAADPELVKDSGRVVDWFFERSGFYDHKAFIVPVGIER